MEISERLLGPMKKKTEAERKDEGDTKTGNVRDEGLRIMKMPDGRYRWR